MLSIQNSNLLYDTHIWSQKFLGICRITYKKCNDSNLHFLHDGRCSHGKQKNHEILYNGLYKFLHYTLYDWLVVACCIFHFWNL